MPAALRVYRRTPPITSERTQVSGLLTEHPYDALIRCAMHDDALKPSPLDASPSTSGLGLVISRKMRAEAAPKSFERSFFRVWNGKRVTEVVSARDGS